MIVRCCHTDLDGAIPEFRNVPVELEIVGKVACETEVQMFAEDRGCQSLLVMQVNRVIPCSRRCGLACWNRAERISASSQWAPNASPIIAAWLW